MIVSHDRILLTDLFLLITEELDSFDDPPSRFLTSFKDTHDEYEQASGVDYSSFK